MSRHYVSPMADGARELENLLYTYAERLDAGDLSHHLLYELH